MKLQPWVEERSLEMPSREPITRDAITDMPRRHIVRRRVFLGHPTDVRRALILATLLGPPRSLDPPPGAGS